MEQYRLELAPAERMTVSELTAAIRSTLTAEFDNVWVQGEISGCKSSAYGHCYFTLKDPRSQVRCVCFRNDLRFVKVKPADGLAVVVRGRLDVYEPRGEYQMIVDAISPFGRADLHLAFEQLKERLTREGLFDAERKRALPKYPRRIGIVTSPQGAVIRDMAGILARRFPGVQVRLYPAQVQGPGSAEQVVAGLRYFGRSQWADLVIVGRGGGSLEDLWTFNEEAVARAIAACPVPVISAVGHETDVTIADFAADVRAATPSAAAELAVPERSAILGAVDGHFGRIARAVRFRVAQLHRAVGQNGMDRAAALLHRRWSRRAQYVDELDYRMRGQAGKAVGLSQRRVAELGRRLERQSPAVRLMEARGRLERLSAALPRAVESRITLLGRRMDHAARALQHLSPLEVLDRGYAIVQAADGRVIADSAHVAVGDSVGIRLGRGRLEAEVRGRELAG